METLTLKILFPYKVFKTLDNISEVVAETADGSFGILPRRLDCVAALVPGILTYKSNEGAENYVAVDEGILVKTGKELTVSVRNAIAGADLGELRQSVDKEFNTLDEREKNVRTVLAKLESGFIHSFEKLRKE